MAVVQISRIQHRKGLQQDLPQLASAEFGWALDARRLYIGNGTIAEGAPVTGVTEILTQYSDILNIGNNYTFKGAQTGYTSQTGPTALTPVQRNLQQKLDDITNVRDFGAVGDGSTDDTASIQRAIDQIYFGNFSLGTPRLRRVLRFPAGTYLISNSLKLPSYAILQGEGRDRTRIEQIEPYPVIQLKDSAGRYDSNYGITSGATISHDIVIRDMTLNNTDSSSNILTLDSCYNVEVSDVRFEGAVSASTSTAVDNQNAVYAVPQSAVIGDITDVTFTSCEFTNCDQGLVINAERVRVMGCLLQEMSRGIVVDTTATTAATLNIKVIGNTFDGIGRQAVLVSNAASTTSTAVMLSMNYFGEVGTGRNGIGNAITPVVSFTGSDNYSIGDVFERPDADHGAYERVSYASRALQAGIDSKTGLTMGMMQQTPATFLTLAASQTNANTGILFSQDRGAVRMHYWLQRDSVSAHRQGTIDVIIRGTNVQYMDEYMEYPNASNMVYPGPTGLTFKVTSINSTMARLEYTTNSSGTADLTYYVTSLNQ